MGWQGREEGPGEAAWHRPRRPFGPHDPRKQGHPSWGRDSAWECTLTRPLPPDLPVLEERARGGQALEGHDRAAPAACGAVAPAEGLRRLEKAQGPRDWPHHARTTSCTTPGRAPAAGEGRTLPARLGQGGIPDIMRATFLGKTSPLLHQASSALPLYLHDSLIRKKWGRS